MPFKQCLKYLFTHSEKYLNDEPPRYSAMEYQQLCDEHEHMAPVLPQRFKTPSLHPARTQSPELPFRTLLNDTNPAAPTAVSSCPMPTRDTKIQHSAAPLSTGGSTASWDDSATLALQKEAEVFEPPHPLQSLMKIYQSR
ncbi:hypothetical protein EJ05DRAFT_513833 [Pseudovirgaria hyperparasitica]|uniref:Uncharacterized protein n=1 Tax=Pseudovirgaria hyperparasitica TaxID=470096 RepID=A0A6A6VZ09_9PEZI|nr:uncharacterized protein EJ05DRAFT_513833 [Pseudovirgaria hyperparasitica]KAF2754930.1 hypothetical protein EJ05DRAFT_513833 [Pseudovirgaria hyperparasitica]